MSSSQVPVKELKARLSHYLAQARSGRVIEVTSHRRVIARVTGVPAHTAPGLERLLASGTVEWHGGKPAGARVELSAGGPGLSDLVLEDRG